MEIRQRFIELLADQLGQEAGKIRDQHLLGADLGADSLDEVELAMEVEEEFDIDISDAEMERLLSVGQYIEFVEKRVSERV